MSNANTTSASQIVQRLVSALAMLTLIFGTLTVIFGLIAFAYFLGGNEQVADMVTVTGGIAKMTLKFAIFGAVIFLVERVSRKVVRV